MTHIVQKSEKQLHLGEFILPTHRCHCRLPVRDEVHFVTETQKHENKNRVRQKTLTTCVWVEELQFSGKVSAELRVES